MYYYTQPFIYVFLPFPILSVFCLQQIHTHQCDTSDDGIGTIFSNIVGFNVLTALVMNSPRL
jgi:hypothetical protein